MHRSSAIVPTYWGLDSESPDNDSPPTSSELAEDWAAESLSSSEVSVQPTPLTPASPAPPSTSAWGVDVSGRHPERRPGVDPEKKMQLAGHILLGLAVLCSLVLGLATWASWVEDKDFREDLMEFAAQVIPPLAFLILGAYYSGQKD